MIKVNLKKYRLAVLLLFSVTIFTLINDKQAFADNFDTFSTRSCVTITYKDEAGKSHTYQNNRCINSNNWDRFSISEYDTPALRSATSITFDFSTTITWGGQSPWSAVDYRTFNSWSDPLDGDDTKNQVAAFYKSGASYPSNLTQTYLDPGPSNIKSFSWYAGQTKEVKRISKTYSLSHNGRGFGFEEPDGAGRSMSMLYYGITCNDESSAEIDPAYDSDKYIAIDRGLPVGGADAAFEIKYYGVNFTTLTARARPDASHYFRPDGTVVSTPSGIWTNSQTVIYGTTATVTTSGFNPEGYTWDHWDGSGACRNAGSNRTCSVSNLTSDTTVDGYYTRNSFKARARVSNGSSWHGEYYKDSGFVKEGEAGLDEIQCSSNSGCSATFWFDLKTITGNGSTTYSIQQGSQNARGEWGWSDVPGKTNKTSTPNSDGVNVETISGDYAIGSTTCYRIRYKPYGDESNGTFKTVSACAKIMPSTFEGKTVLTGAANATAGYTSSNSPRSIDEKADIENCSPTSGCTVSFSHYLKRTSGLASTSYKIERESNYIASPKGISAGSIKSGNSFNSDRETLVSDNNSTNLTLYPGMVVCEWLTFAPNNLPGTADIYTRICVHAHGNAQPPDDSNPDKPENPDQPSDDSSFLNIKVRNPFATSKYNNYQREVYAKPGDTVTYRATYNPVLQYTYYLAPQKISIDGGTIYPTSSINKSLLMYTMFNRYKGSNLRNWNNAFSVQKGANNESFSLILNGNYTYERGNTTKRQETNDYKIKASDAGKSIDEKAITNLNNTVKTTPGQVTFTDNSNNNLANVITTSISKIAFARIPYNYINTTTITDDSFVAYAGEPLTINYSYIINPKTNNETSPNTAYATKVDAPQWRLAVKVGNGAWERTAIQSSPRDNDFAVSIGKMFTGRIGDDAIKLATTINIPDVAAGTTICVIPEVYPATSGADTNYSDEEGDHNWRSDTAQQKCFKVSKKPNLQVWGGNIYSRGSIKTSVAVKNSLEGYTTYSLNNTDGAGKNSYIFGSWVESGLISNGEVRGLASGAGTGFATNNGGNLSPAYTFGNNYNGLGNNSPRVASPGGSYETNQNFCIRSTLTFANETCARGFTGGLNSATTNNSIDNDKSSILNKFISGSHDENVSGTVALNDSSKITYNGSYYYYSKSSLNIPGASINKHTIQVVHSGQDITISGDLIYEDSYATLDEIPKLIIYAKNITISCEVIRIDALLVADDQVKTCDSDDISDRRNSYQLKINGAVITSSLIPNRTYGAATGANSIIPAEIINYDPSLYLWGGNDMAGDNSANNMDVNYIHEMAPRY